MKTSSRPRVVARLAVAFAGAPDTCSDVANDVRTAVSKDPSKVLMIVEDALVINESCACEIVKAAITASNADKALIEQITQTAISVAPKMAAIIAECANATVPGSVAALEPATETVATAEPTVSSKNPKNPVIPVAPPPVSDDDTVAFGQGPIDIRGVYLIQPAATGFVTPQDDDDDDDKKRPSPRTPHSRRTRSPTPMSPSVAG
jgi:hypothetical protein